MPNVQTIHLNRSLVHNIRCVIYVEEQTIVMAHTITGLGTTTGNATITVTFPDLDVGSYIWRIIDTKNNSVYRTGIYSVIESMPAKTFVGLAYGSTITWDYSDGYNAKVTLTGDAILDIQNAENGDAGTIVVIQDAVGGRTLTLPGLEINGGVSFSSSPGVINILAWLYDGENFYWNAGNEYS